MNTLHRSPHRGRSWGNKAACAGGLVLGLLLLGSCATPAQPANRTVPTSNLLTFAEGFEALATQLTTAQRAATNATEASSVITLKHYVDETFATIWGQPSGLLGSTGAIQHRTWKTRWQTRFSDFDPAYGARYKDSPPIISDPSALGMMGLGRQMRRHLGSTYPDYENKDQLLAPLNNLIGWTRLDDGITKAERQPRIDLTYMWDAPQAFWLGEADTGWLAVVEAQAINILKTEYGTDLELARRHAEDLLALVQRCQDGLDANGNGLVEALPMEGAFNTLREVLTAQIPTINRAPVNDEAVNEEAPKDL